MIRSMTKLCSTSSGSATLPAKVVIFGGNGYVGQSIVASLLFHSDKPCQVTSISRSGKPVVGPYSKHLFEQVTWAKGNVFDPLSYQHHLKDTDCAVSCIGAFGSNKYMEKINGDANVLAVSEALRAGVKRFVFISTIENTLPSFLLSGYFKGKRRAEDAVRDAFPDSGFVLRPGFMYGTRHERLLGSEVSVPLDLLGRPLDFFLSLPGPDKLKDLPGMRALLSRPLPVTTVGAVAANIALNGLATSVTLSNKNVLTVEDIRSYPIFKSGL